MAKRIVLLPLFICALLAFSSREARAQQSLNLSVGVFTPHSEDARVDDDVLNENRTFLTFDLKDFNGTSVSGEWLAPIGDFFEVGAGIGFYRRTVPSVYSDFIDVDGTEIDQETRLRIVPLTATARVLLGGRGAPVQPYLGAGVGLFNWRYSESGEFINFNLPSRPIFRDSFVASGNEVGSVAVLGVRFPIGSWTAGGEARYHKAEGDLNEDFAGSKIDLGGWTYQFTLGIRFN